MTETPHETIGDRLKRLRGERGLSQRQIACPGVSAQYISKIEQGARQPSMKALRKLAPKLGVTVLYLETGEDEHDLDRWTFALADLELALRLGEPPGDIAEQLEDMIQKAGAAGYARVATRALITFGLWSAHTGDNARAADLLQQAVAEPWITPSSDPDAYAALGHALAATERQGEAVRLYRVCLAELHEVKPEPGNTIARFATYLSYALTELGDMEGTQAALVTAFKYGRNSTDPYTRIRISWAHARAAVAEGNHDLARRHVDEAIALLRETEDQGNLARAHLLAAEIALHAESYEEAGHHLAEAERLLPGGSSLEDQAYLHVQFAMVVSRSGDPADALTRARAAVELLGEAEDPAIRGAAQWALAEAHTAAGEHDEARAAFTRASELIPPGHKDAPRLVAAWERATALAPRPG